MADFPSSSQVVSKQWQVFISFSGQDLRNNFISHLEGAFKQAEINYYIDNKETPSESQNVIFTRIQQSQIALPIFSSQYAESKWCLNELVEVMKQAKQGKLRVIPIFFNVTPKDVGSPYGSFGCKVYVESQHNPSSLPIWTAALKSATGNIGLLLKNYSNERLLIQEIVSSVKEVLDRLPSLHNVISREISPVTSGSSSSSEKSLFDDAMNHRIKQLAEMIDFSCDQTQIVGIVGMPGIGKTTLAKMYFDNYSDRYVFNKIISNIREMVQLRGHHYLESELLKGQELNDEAKIFSKKIFLVLDDVSQKKHIEFLLHNRRRIRKGSKIVITTRDKSSIAELFPEIYVVPPMNDTDAWQLFKDHAFKGGVSSTTGNFPKLTQKFVDYAGGNPLALVELGKELNGKDEAEWATRLENLPYKCNVNISRELRISYEELTVQQKDAFLDIACFFRSEEENYVKCLLDSECGDVVKKLAEKFFVCISGGKIEMHNLLCAFGKEIRSGERMCDHRKTTAILRDAVQQETKYVRGIFLDTCTETKGIPVDRERFTEKFNPMNLRYLKIYDSHFPENCKVYLPERLDFPFEKIRYLHWDNFDLEELPSDFNPKNLIDLRLPYNKKIERVWGAVKELPRLKWVDLSHSTKLTDLSALSKAFDLRRLNLKGCTSLEKLPEDMGNMKKLVFLNLRGCTTLSSLPEKLNLISLNTIILSGCSSFNKFELISNNLEFLHLDGTIISTLPPTIQNFKKLVLLNLKNCTMLESLPDCLDKLKALEELMLSGCSRLRTFPKIKVTMENLQILLLDGTSVEKPLQDQLEMNGLSMLRRLCLSRNDMIKSLQPCISKLYNLQWMDLRYCKNLTSLLTLPPNLQYLNAHGCISLKTVASPLALLLPTEKGPSSFIFTNCEKLEHVAKNEIICYVHNKTRISSDALNRHNKGLAFETLAATCFPGSVVPAWFDNKASGAVLERELPPYLRDNGFVGIALCAVVSFKNYKIQNNNFMVKCICELNNVEKSSSFFNFHIGDLSETDNQQQCRIKSTHVFIGFTSLFNGEMRRVPTKASIRFEVTDGTSEDAKCEVLKCGFSLVCESDNGSWHANAEANQLVCEPDNGVSDAKADAVPKDNGSGADGSSRGDELRPGEIEKRVKVILNPDSGED
ncbi:Disease resistance protein (TIR-NBS-LRR class) family [Raphanus sativus]|nr:Disease resistance protein (TIR-NBS-LRR class) family [Raphanus sativus]